jgi:hypothetical protein
VPGWRCSYIVHKGHSRGLNMVVCVCRHPKIIKVLILPSAECMSIIATVLPVVVFYDAAWLLY